MITALIAAALVFVNAPDGDTMVVRDGTAKMVLRPAEIDAPERMQSYSQVSRRNLIELCKDAKAIEVQPVSLDRYGRTVAHVHCDGVHVNWRQVQDGLAWCFHKYLTQPSVCIPLEKDAMNARRGLCETMRRCRLGNFARAIGLKTCDRDPNPDRRWCPYARRYESWRPQAEPN
jgi:micrococcal nuclease